MSTPALIGLGGNLGDRKGHLDFAVAALSQTPDVTVKAVSAYRETAPVGGPGGQGSFLNAALLLETSIGPEPLLDRLNAIEQEAGRVRVVRWGERTLDLDLLLFGDQRIETPRLRVPHPRMALRRFALSPAAEIAPEAVDPVTGRTVRDLLANLDRRPSYVAIASGPHLDEFPFIDMTRFFSPEGVGLAERLCQALPATAVEGPVGKGEIGSEATSDVLELATRTLRSWLDADALARSGSADTWLVSHFWFDALFLSLDSLKSARPRLPRYHERFLEARSTVLSPTFVVARHKDIERYGIQNPRYAWRRPIGWDTPILEVEDFDSESAPGEIVATCLATRAD